MSTQGSVIHEAFHVPLVLQRSPEILFLGATQSDAAFEYNTVKSNFQDRKLMDPPAMFAAKLTLLGGLY